MPSRFLRANPTAVMVGLTFALIVSGALPLLGSPDAEAAKRSQSFLEGHRRERPAGDGEA